jgi:predicted  nucleic acid-binding Zn-ribbon protein
MSWVTDVWNLTRTVIRLADDLQKYHAEIKEVRQDVLKMALQMQRMSDEIELIKQRTSSEIENIRQRAEHDRETAELRLKVGN